MPTYILLSTLTPEGRQYVVCVRRTPIAALAPAASGTDERHGKQWSDTYA